MKALKFSISVFLALTVASSAFAGDPKIVQRYMGLGIGAEKAKALATPISVGLTVTNINLTPVAGVTPTSGNASFGSTTVKGLTVTKTDGTPVAGITPASGNISGAAISGTTITGTGVVTGAGVIVTDASGTPVAGFTPASGDLAITGDLTTNNGDVDAGSGTIYSGSAEIGILMVDKVLLNQTPIPILTPGVAFPTPATGVKLDKRWSRVVAGAPTANFVQLEPATTHEQHDFGLINESEQPVAIVAQGANTVNGAVANTPFACAAGKRCDCKGTSSSTYQCVGM